MRKKKNNKILRRSVTSLVIIGIFLFSFGASPTAVSAAEEDAPPAQSVTAQADISISIDGTGTAFVTEQWTLDTAGARAWCFVRPDAHSMLAVVDENNALFEETNYMSEFVETTLQTQRAILKEYHSKGSLYYIASSGTGMHSYTLTYQIENAGTKLKLFSGAIAKIPLFVYLDSSNTPDLISGATLVQPSPLNIHFQSDEPIEEASRQAWFTGAAGALPESSATGYTFACPQLDLKENATLYARIPKSALHVQFESIGLSLDEYLWKELDGTSLQQDKPSNPNDQKPLIILGVLFAGFVLLMLWSYFYGNYFYKSYKYRLARRSAGQARNFKKVGYRRSLPLNDCLSASYSALNLVKDLPGQSTIVGAILLDWIRRSAVLLQNSPQGPCISFLPTPPNLPAEEHALYQIFIDAAGENRLLEPNEFAQWAKKNSRRLQAWLLEYDMAGLYSLHQMKVVETRVAHQWGQNYRVAEQSAIPIPFSKNPAQQLSAMPAGAETMGSQMLKFRTNIYFTKEGRNKLADVYGFRNYLKDFTILEDRFPQEVLLWQRYLVYAQLFGIATTVAESFKKTYPSSFSSTSSSLFIAVIGSGLLNTVDKIWFDIITRRAKDDALGTR